MKALTPVQKAMHARAKSEGEVECWGQGTKTAKVLESMGLGYFNAARSSYSLRRIVTAPARNTGKTLGWRQLQQARKAGRGIA